MQEELVQFERNKVWSLVPLRKGRTPIRTKWILKNRPCEGQNRSIGMNMFSSIQENYRQGRMKMKLGLGMKTRLIK